MDQKTICDKHIFSGSFRYWGEWPNARQFHNFGSASTNELHDNSRPAPGPPRCLRLCPLQRVQPTSLGPRGGLTLQDLTAVHPRGFPVTPEKSKNEFVVAGKSAGVVLVDGGYVVAGARKKNDEAEDLREQREQQRHVDAVGAEEDQPVGYPRQVGVRQQLDPEQRVETRGF